jgi:hypothetical protein
LIFADSKNECKFVFDYLYPLKQAQVIPSIQLQLNEE